MIGMVDIHSHLIPGIDDGPSDLEGSVEMARAALSSGVATIAATPHLRGDFPDVDVHELGERAERVREELARCDIPLEVVQGAETSLVWALEADEDELRLASYDGRGRDLLIETPWQTTVIEQLVERIQARGVRVTLAHPERSQVFQRDPERVRALAQQGVLLQLNAESLLGGWRSGPRPLARWLCREGLVHALASDGHRASQWRPITAMAEGVQVAVELVGEARAAWMACEAPAAIVTGEPLPQAPEVEPQGTARRRFGLRR